MRGADVQQAALFSYKTLEERVPQDHPLRLVRVVVNGILASLDSEFAKLYSLTGRPSIPPERLLRASLLQIFYTVRSERQLMEQLDFNLLYRWFVGLEIDETVWDHSTFSQNRDRLLTQEVARDFFRRVVDVAEGHGLLSEEHFSVDGTLIEAWASHKSFRAKDGEPPAGGSEAGRDVELDFKGEKRSNATHASTTDPEAKLYRKGEGKEAKPCFMGHALMDNRHGLVVDAEIGQTSGTAECEAAGRMAQRQLKAGATLGADKGYDTKALIAYLMALGVLPHIARNITEHRGSAVPDRVAEQPGYAVSQRARKRIEQIFGWSKLIGPLRKTKLRGVDNVATQALFTFAAYNLVRLNKLLCLRPVAVPT